MSQTNLRQKLLKVAEEIGFIEFDGHNPMYSKKTAKKKANFASAAGVIRKLNAALTKHGVVLTVIREDVQFYEDSGLAIVTSVGEFRDTGTNEVITAVGSGSGKDHGDKAVMKASTAAYKYLIAHSLCLGWGAEDPEADTTTDTPAAKGAKGAKGAKTPKASQQLVKTIKDAIKAAEDLSVLEKVKLDIQKMDSKSKDYKACVAAWKARKSELEAA